MDSAELVARRTSGRRRRLSRRAVESNRALLLSRVLHPEPVAGTVEAEVIHALVDLAEWHEFETPPPSPVPSHSIIENHSGPLTMDDYDAVMHPADTP